MPEKAPFADIQRKLDAIYAEVVSGNAKLDQLSDQVETGVGDPYETFNENEYGGVQIMAIEQFRSELVEKYGDDNRIMAIVEGTRGPWDVGLPKFILWWEIADDDQRLQIWANTSRENDVFIAMSQGRNRGRFPDEFHVYELTKRADGRPGTARRIDPPVEGMVCMVDTPDTANNPRIMQYTAKWIAEYFINHIQMQINKELRAREQDSPDVQFGSGG